MGDTSLCFLFCGTFLEFIRINKRVYCFFNETRLNEKRKFMENRCLIIQTGGYTIIEELKPATSHDKPHYIAEM